MLENPSKTFFEKLVEVVSFAEVSKILKNCVLNRFLKVVTFEKVENPSKTQFVSPKS